jgi:hypothetical protein
MGLLDWRRTAFVSKVPFLNIRVPPPKERLDEKKRVGKALMTCGPVWTLLRRGGCWRSD